MDEGPSSSDNSNGNVSICSDEIAPAILSTSGTWLRLSMPYFPKKSVVWRYFDLYESDGYSRADTERIVKCRLMSCMRKELRLDAQSSTKGMWEHLRNKHPDEALKCENGFVAPQEEPNSVTVVENSAGMANLTMVAPNRTLPDIFAPYSSMADEKKYETIHQLIGKLLESMEECQDRVHISGQQSLLSFADYARLLTKAKTTTQFVCQEAPLLLPQPGTIVIYDTKDSGDPDADAVQIRDRLRQDGYSFDNNDSGLLPDNLYITRYFNGNGDDFEDGRIMRYEVTTTFEDAGYVLFHYVKGTKYEVEPKGNTGDILVHCYKPKAPRLKRTDESKRKTDGFSNHGSSLSYPPVKMKRTELDGLQAIAGCLPPSFQAFFGNSKLDVGKEENGNGMDQSFEENMEATGSGVDDSQIEDSCSGISGLLTSSHQNKDVKQKMYVNDTELETKVEKRVMNILKKAVRDQRRSKVHYLARRTKNVNWVKVADQLQKKAVQFATTKVNINAIPVEDIMRQGFEQEVEDDNDIDSDNEGDSNDVGNSYESSGHNGQLLSAVDCHEI